MKELDLLLKHGYSVADLEKLRMQVLSGDSGTKEQDLAEIDNVIKNIPDADLSKKEYLKREAMRKVAILVKELIGDRSIRRTAEDSGVAASYITGILKGNKYLPSADILRKLAAADAKPQNGITLEDLMVAAGYQTDYVEEEIKMNLYEVRDDNGKTLDISPSEEFMRRMTAYVSEVNAQEELRRSSMERHRAYRQEREKFESMSTGIIYKALADKGIRFSNANEVAVGVRGFRPDMTIYVPMQPILEWCFDFKYIEFDSREIGRYTSQLKRYLGMYMFVEPKLERKLSMVIGNKEAFEALRGYQDKLSYRGDLSVILIDTEQFKVVDEFYLAHYRERDSESEFFIV